MFIKRHKKSAQRIWSKDLMYEKTFWLSSHKLKIPFNVLYRTVQNNNCSTYFCFT